MITTNSYHFQSPTYFICYVIYYGQKLASTHTHCCNCCIAAIYFGKYNKIQNNPREAEVLSDETSLSYTENILIIKQ